MNGAHTVNTVAEAMSKKKKTNWMSLERILVLAPWLTDSEHCELTAKAPTNSAS